MRWLAETGFPVVPPSPLVPAEPVVRDGFCMTFRQWVETTGDEADHRASARRTPALHEALRDYPDELPFMASPDETIPSGFDVLESRPDLLPADDLARARQEWAALEPVLTTPRGFAAAFPGIEVRPVHGDAPSYNVIRTRGGLLFSDFELVTLGSVEWDMALLPPDHVDAYDEGAADRGLRPLDRDVLAVMDAARMLQVVSCLALVPRLPALVESLAPALEHWRSQPHAAGLVTAP